MIGLMLATLILGHNAPVMQQAGTATIDSGLPTGGDTGAAARAVQKALPAGDVISSVSLAGGYALVGWTRNGSPAGEAVLADTGGWVILSKGSGLYDAQSLIGLGLTGRAASELLEGATPLTPDVGYTPLVGSWQCTGAAGPTRQKFAMDPASGWLTFQSTWTSASGAAETANSYLFWDAPSRRWSTATVGTQGVSYTGRSNGWRNQTLIFDGVQTAPSSSTDVRETLQVASDGSLLNMWEARAGHSYTMTSSAHCVKVSP